MYLSFYGLSEKPFNLTPDPDFLYLSRSHKEALAHLTYGVESRSGFVLVTGEVGSGKTTLLRTLIRGLGSSLLLSQVTNTRVSYKELLELILADFGLNPNGYGKPALLSMLNEFLIERYREGRSCLLIVDEAQNLGSGCLEGLRMLSNLETEKAKLLHTILVGQPGLNGLIDSPELEQLRQRVSVRYHLGPLSGGETSEYVRHRIARVSSDPDLAPVFPDEVIPRVYEATGGIPRLINVLCDAALLHGYAEDKRVMDVSVIEAAAALVTRPVPPQEPQEVAPPSALEARLAQLEATLDGMSAARSSPQPPGPDVEAKGALLAKKEKELASREERLSKRAAELEARETELRRRVSLAKEQWSRKVRELEKARTSLVGKRQLPPPLLRVEAHDPDPRVLDWIVAALRAAEIDVEPRRDYEALRTALADARDPGSFVVCVLGGTSPHPVNEGRLRELSSEQGYVPVVYFDDLDLSTLRRRMFMAGAAAFLEKPLRRGGSDSAEAAAELLVRTVTGLYERHVKWLGEWMGG